MRWPLSFAFAFAWAAVVQAKSFTGNRLLVVLEEQGEQAQYSAFLEDLTGRSISLSKLQWLVQETRFEELLRIWSHSPTWQLGIVTS